MSDVLQQLLEAIDTETGKNLLADLRDPDRRSPQLYNAIGKYLERHKFTIAKLQPDASLLGELADALKGFKAISDEDLYSESVKH